MINVVLILLLAMLSVAIALQEYYKGFNNGYGKACQSHKPYIESLELGIDKATELFKKYDNYIELLEKRIEVDKHGE